MKFALDRPGTNGEHHAVEEQAHLSLRVTIRMALSEMPWELLNGTEKGRRDHTLPILKRYPQLTEYWETHFAFYE